MTPDDVRIFSSAAFRLFFPHPVRGVVSFNPDGSDAAMMQHQLTHGKSQNERLRLHYEHTFFDTLLQKN